MAKPEFPLSQEELESFYAKGQKFNVMETLKTGPLPNITFDGAMERGDFFMTRRQWTDGTHVLAYIMMREMLEELLNQTPYAIRNPPDSAQQLDGIRYIIGPLSLVEGEDPKAETFRAWRELFLMPVKCEYVYRNAERTT
jgi:hypothetical protein